MDRDAPGVTKAVMFGDLSGFTALTEAHGDGGAADVAGRFFALAASVLPGGAQVVKTIGDAVMIVADDARSGLDAALGVLRAVGREEAFPGIRIGLNVGPIVERVGDVFGSTVNAAARLTEHAHVGQVLTTGPLASLVVEADQVCVTALGPTHLKNIGDPMEIFSVEDNLRRPSAEVLDPVCRMYVDADDAPARLPWGDRIWLFCSFECATKFSANPERYTAG